MSKELLFSITKKDFRVDTFRSGGPGGQKQNKTSSGVRITHIETGISAESREERSQLQNRKKAFLRLVERPEFQLYLKKRIARACLDMAEIKRQVEDWMREENLKIEYFTPEVHR